MAKKRTRQQNPEPFVADDNAATVSKKRNKPPKHHQLEQKLKSSGTSSKILKEALIQQKEINEENEGRNPNNLVFAEDTATEVVSEEDDIDDFGGFSETQSQFGGYESGTCNLREAVIIGSIIQKVSIPPLHSSVALLRLAEMENCGTTSYFIKLLIEKKYALPYRMHLFPIRLQVTPEILRELNSSRNRGDKEDDLKSIYILIIIAVT
ncbi:hypothetical protein RHMOL_Rhmol09G0151300 [Rhododendron molle]|uniref:Uncharacterized protein n=1 Tax=Rhododendron molle TaxID=49168 RepID=A0ACC0MEZ2_RHOML|nr:hypothetical protein RHMOL_Rhmol09G0151300 [Rhododendron molle]